MGERKGTNHYYPPDYDPKKGGLNKFLGTHALRERARKIHLGILIIRFEMPYNIWCDGCGNHIGMGVRYNAEKTKIGMYYTTPVYQFRMKCHLCDNHFEIKTDPGNLDYVIVSGARRQENRWDPTQNEQVVPETKETSRKLYDDAMFKLEHIDGDHDKAKKIKPALEKLAYHRERKWKDDYSANCLLRTNFRIRERELKRREENDKALLKRSSLDIPLLPETDEDKKMASLLALTPAKSINEREEQSREKILNRPALPSYSKRSSTSLKQRLSKHLLLPSFQRDELVTSTNNKANIMNNRSETITSKSQNSSNSVNLNEAIKKEDKVNITFPSDSESLNKQANKSHISLVSNEYESSTDSEENI